MNLIEKVLFIAYMALAVSFYGFSGLTFIPQLVGIALAGFFFVNLLINRRKVGGVVFIRNYFFLLLLFLMGFLGQGDFNSTFYFSLVQIYLLGVIAINIARYSGLKGLLLIGLLSGCIILIYTRISESGTYFDFAGRRFEGQAGNPNDYSFFLAMTLVLLLWQWLSRKSFSLPINLFFLTTFAVLGLELMIYGGSRTMTLALLLPLTALIFRQMAKGSWISKIAIIGLLWTGVYQISKITTDFGIISRFQKATQTFQGGSGAEFSTEYRMRLVEEGFRLWSVSPIWGHGTNQFRYVNSVLYDFYAHNNFAEILANNGLLGFLLFYFPHLAVILMVNRRWNNKPQGIWYVNFIILALLIADIGMVSYYNKIYIGILAYILGYMIYLRNTDHNALQYNLKIA